MKVTMSHTGKKEEQPIDWGKPMLVESTVNKTMVMTVGKHSGRDFSGVVIFSHNDTYDKGKYSDQWNKEKFTPTPPNEIYTFNISND